MNTKTKSVEEWAVAGRERLLDAATLARDRPNSVGVIYLAGYAIEISLKMLLAELGKTPPHIHDLRKLWVDAGFHLSDLRDQDGTKSFFFEQWTVALRYEGDFDPPLPPEKLLKSAGLLCGYINKRLQRASRQRQKWKSN